MAKAWLIYLGCICHAYIAVLLAPTRPPDITYLVQPPKHDGIATRAASTHDLFTRSTKHTTAVLRRERLCDDIFKDSHPIFSVLVDLGAEVEVSLGSL